MRGEPARPLTDEEYREIIRSGRWDWDQSVDHLAAVMGKEPVYMTMEDFADFPKMHDGQGNLTPFGRESIKKNRLAPSGPGAWPFAADPGPDIDPGGEFAKAMTAQDAWSEEPAEDPDSRYWEDDE